MGDRGLGTGDRGSRSGDRGLETGDGGPGLSAIFLAIPPECLYSIQSSCGDSVLHRVQATPFHLDLGICWRLIRARGLNADNGHVSLAHKMLAAAC